MTNAASDKGEGIIPVSQLPRVDAASRAPVLGELLARPTALGETTALHVKLPPPRNRQLANTLVRLIGDPESPQLLFRSDALAELGVIPRSPGRDFFTSFATLSPDELSTIKRNTEEIASGRFGETTRDAVVFDGRTPVAVTNQLPIEPADFKVGNIIPIRGCPLKPASTLAGWGKSLFITHPAVVKDPARTWDPCTGAGTKGGVWTFAHLMREMAQGSGGGINPDTPAEQFALDWLSLWLNDYAPNNDLVSRRTQMFNQVIRPWAIASGQTATLVLNPRTNKLQVTLSGPLDLDIAPFRLVAVVNRIDLGETVSGPGGYGGGTTDLPVTAGELRFIFTVVQPNPWGAGTEGTCGKKRFTTIFEYGVPRRGCASVVDWAHKWTALEGQPGFTPAYLAQLEGMTESVVKHGAAPTKGNKNAINQIRTNEIALSSPWELREFTLTDEQPAANTNLPASGPLRTHTVAMTVDDAVFDATGGDPVVNPFVTGPVTAGVPPPAVNPGRCSSVYDVPFQFNGFDFRAGNAEIGPGHWEANTVATNEEICARFQFSLNNCHGCHFDDSGTNGFGGSTSFTHIDPLSPIPVTLSKFLTGGGPGLTFNVPDTQFGAGIMWPFADLERRHQRLWDLSQCTSCVRVIRMKEELVRFVQRINGRLPIDGDPRESPFEIGPVTDLKVVDQLIGIRKDVSGEPTSEPADFVREVRRASH